MDCGRVAILCEGPNLKRNNSNSAASWKWFTDYEMPKETGSILPGVVNLSLHLKEVKDKRISISDESDDSGKEQVKASITLAHLTTIRALTRL